MAAKITSTVPAAIATSPTLVTSCRPGTGITSPSSGNLVDGDPGTFFGVATPDRMPASAAARGEYGIRPLPVPGPRSGQRRARR
jgi:hypothetical protein